MGAGGSTGKTVTSLSKERRKEKKEKRRARRKQNRANRRKRRKELKEEPPAPAMLAAETRGDVTEFVGVDEEVVKLCLCKRNRLEFIVDGVWKKAITGIQVSTSEDNFVTIKSSRGLALVESEWSPGLNQLLLQTARLADLAAIKHDMWMHVREVEPQGHTEVRCTDCGLVVRSAPPFCEVTGRIHPPQLWLPQTPAGVGFQHPSWTEATQLPAGMPQPSLSMRRYSTRAPTSLSLDEVRRSDSVVNFVTADDEVLSLTLAQTSRIELYSSTTWVTSILAVELATEKDKIIKLRSAKGTEYEVQLSDDFKEVIPKIGVLCDAACVHHNLWGGSIDKVRVWACPACMFKNSDVELCSVCGAVRPDLLRVGRHKKTVGSTSESFYSSVRSSSPRSPAGRKRVAQGVTLPPLPGSTSTSPTHPPSRRPSHFGHFGSWDETDEDTESDTDSEDTGLETETTDEFGRAEYETDGITSDEDISSPPASPRTKDRRNKKKNCVLCNAAVKNTVLMPCRHLGVCNSCAPGLKTCPVCKGLVTHRLEVWA